MNKFLALLLFFLTVNCYAQEISFNCSGVNKIIKGENIYAPNSQSEVKNFDLGANTKNADLFGFPVYVNVACSESSSKKNCSIDSMSIQCSCESDIAQSRMSLSRNTGVFKVIHTYKKSGGIQEGEYSCKKIEKKVF
jgi:hypothetical protein